MALYKKERLRNVCLHIKKEVTGIGVERRRTGRERTIVLSRRARS